MTAIIDLLERRIAHLKAEEARNPRAEYGRLCHWRRLEVEHLLQKIEELVEPEDDDRTDY